MSKSPVSKGILFAFFAAMLLAFVGTSVSAAPIDPGLTPASARAQLPRRPLERFGSAQARGLYVPNAAVVRSSLRVRVRPASKPFGTRSSSKVFNVPGIDGFFGIGGFGNGTVFDGDARRYSGVPRGDLRQDPPSAAIPEPAGALLFAAGFALVALRTRRA